MTQHLLVQAEVTPPVVKAAGANKAVSTDTAETQPFSSELNKQIDKHAKPQKSAQEPVEQSDTGETASKQEAAEKAEKVDGDDGKNLPKETADKTETKDSGESADTEASTDKGVESEKVVATAAPVTVTVKTDDTVEVNDESDAAKKAAKQTETAQQKETPKQQAAPVAVASVEAEKTKAEDVKATQSAATSAKTVSAELASTAKTAVANEDTVGLKNESEVKTHIKVNVEPTDEKKAVKKTTVELTTQQKANSQQTGAELKVNNIQQKEAAAVTAKELPQVAVEGLASDQKKQAKALRPDILYGINKKYSAEGAKSDIVTTTEKVMTSERLATKAMSEGQLMADVVKQVKPGLQQSTSTASSPGGLVTAHTPAASASQGQATTATPVLDIQPAIKTAAWNRVMSGRVVWMAREGVQQAELKLNPARLGPVEVRLNVVNDQTSVTFIATHATTREALEQALPRLRESFSENGMELADAEVMQHSSEQQNQDDAAETDESGIMSSQTSAESEEFSGDEQPINNEQDELDVGLSLYA